MSISLRCHLVSTLMSPQVRRHFEFNSVSFWFPAVCTSVSSRFHFNFVSISSRMRVDVAPITLRGGGWLFCCLRSWYLLVLIMTCLVFARVGCISCSQEFTCCICQLLSSSTLIAWLTAGQVHERSRPLIVRVYLCIYIIIVIWQPERIKNRFPWLPSTVVGEYVWHRMTQYKAKK